MPCHIQGLPTSHLLLEMREQEVYSLPRTSTRRTNRFRGTSNRTSKQVRRTPINSDDGGTQIETVTRTRQGQRKTVERRTPIPAGGSQISTETEETPARNRPNVKAYSPVRAGEKAAGVGLLEAEFIGSLLLLVILLFADTNKSYADKIMSIMKRGTLISLLFFILALMSGIGPSMSKVSKAIGAMVFVGILVSSPVLNIFSDLDKFFKADWSSTGEHGTDVGQTSTPSSPGGVSGALHAAEGAVNRITQIINSFGFGIIK
jgi:hypothetical protein